MHESISLICDFMFQTFIRYRLWTITTIALNENDAFCAWNRTVLTFIVTEINSMSIICIFYTVMFCYTRLLNFFYKFENLLFCVFCGISFSLLRERKCSQFLRYSSLYAKTIWNSVLNLMLKIHGFLWLWRGTVWNGHISLCYEP